MNKLLGLAVALCVSLFATLAGAATRTRELIKRDWTFTLGNPALAQTARHDTAK